MRARVHAHTHTEQMQQDTLYPIGEVGRLGGSLKYGDICPLDHYKLTSWCKSEGALSLQIG